MRDGWWRMVGLAALSVLVGGEVRAHEKDSTAAMTNVISQASPSDTSSATTPAVGAEEEPSSRLRVSMEFQNAQLKDILKAFSQQSGINVIARSDISNGTMTLYLEDVTVMDALDQILRVGNLTYERPPGSDIYIVKPKEDESAKKEKPIQPITRVYKLKYARVSKSILGKTAAAFGSKTPFEATLQQRSGGGGGGGGGGDVGIDLVIGKLLTDHGALVVDERTNSLIITDVPENFPRLEAALAALDVRTAQIMVDAELIETSLSKAKDLGIKWGTGTSGQLITFTPTSRRTRFPFNIFKEGIQPGSLASTDARTPFTASTLDLSSFKAVLEAIEADADTKILARPKVLTLDNESAVVRLTTDEAIGFQTSSQATTGTQTATPERTTTGVVLVVTPQINDNGFITMMVEPSVTKTVTSNLSPPTGQSKPKDPKTRSSRTMVRIHTGDTLVVGGLIDRSEQQTKTTVPVLSGIPVVGEAFKHTDVSNSSSELLVFITPRILDEPIPQLASTTQGSSVGLREQEPAGGARQDAIEQALNVHEQPR